VLQNLSVGLATVPHWGQALMLALFAFRAPDAARGREHKRKPSRFVAPVGAVL
jgi:hypothetical protein